MKKLCPESERYDLARCAARSLLSPEYRLPFKYAPPGPVHDPAEETVGAGEKAWGLERKTLMTEMETGVCEGVGIT